MIVDSYLVLAGVTVHDHWSREVIHNLETRREVIHRLDVELAGVAEG
jgi:hypothetical protein